MAPNSMMREQEAAVYLGLSVVTLRKWRLTGGGPAFVKLGKAVRYREEDLRAFAEARLRRSTSDPGADAATA